MQTRNRNTFTTIHTEGALLPVDLLAQRLHSPAVTVDRQRAALRANRISQGHGTRRAGFSAEGQVERRYILNGAPPGYLAAPAGRQQDAPWHITPFRHASDDWEASSPDRQRRRQLIGVCGEFSRLKKQQRC